MHEHSQCSILKVMKRNYISKFLTPFKKLLLTAIIHYYMPKKVTDDCLAQIELELKLTLYLISWRGLQTTKWGHHQMDIYKANGATNRMAMALEWSPFGLFVLGIWRGCRKKPNIQTNNQLKCFSCENILSKNNHYLIWMKFIENCKN